MANINYENLPSTTTPLNATNLNSMQDDLARIVFKGYYTGSQTATFTFPRDSIYLVVGHTNGADRGLFEIVYGRGQYHTTVSSSTYITTSYSNNQITITTQYTNYIRIIEL